MARIGSPTHCMIINRRCCATGLPYTVRFLRRVLMSPFFSCSPGHRMRPKDYSDKGRPVRSASHVGMARPLGLFKSGLGFWGLGFEAQAWRPSHLNQRRPELRPGGLHTSTSAVCSGWGAWFRGSSLALVTPQPAPLSLNQAPPARSDFVHGLPDQEDRDEGQQWESDPLRDHDAAVVIHDVLVVLTAVVMVVLSSVRAHLLPLKRLRPRANMRSSGISDKGWARDLDNSISGGRPRPARGSPEGSAGTSRGRAERKSPRRRPRCRSGRVPRPSVGTGWCRSASRSRRT